jgi:5-methylcytosine-specific restriction protein A
MFKMTSLVSKHLELYDKVDDILQDIDEYRSKRRNVAATQREAVVQSRVGQGPFRSEVLRLWSQRCAVSGLDIPELLRASHIKPWRKSSDEERLNPFNGLLLAPSIDQAFDSGYITFDELGYLKRSPNLPPRAARALGLPQRGKLRAVPSASAQFLAYHREHVFQAT